MDYVGKYVTTRSKLKVKSKERFPFTNAHVSISHLTDYAIAMVILEKEE